MKKLDRDKLQEIDRFLEEYYEKGATREAAAKMVKLKKTQVRGLENLLVSATRFSEIINYIKNQAGKGREEWQSVAPELLKQLSEIESKAQEMFPDDPEQRLLVKLKLARGWGRQIVAHYLYGKV